jgi:hypothetical protein
VNIRFLNLALVLISPIVGVGAQNPATAAPGDILFELGCPRSPCRFQQGEVILLKLSFVAAGAGYSVKADGGESLRQRGWETFTAQAQGGVGDPLEGSSVVPNSSGIFDTPRLIPRRPFDVRAELNQWIRFGRPGTYRVTARTSRVFRGDFQEAIKAPTYVESDPLDIEIVPADPGWQRAQLVAILAELPRPGAAYSANSSAAVRALSYLGSEDALVEIRKRLPDGLLSEEFVRENPSNVFGWEMARLELLRHPAPLAH